VSTFTLKNRLSVNEPDVVIVFEILYMLPAVPAANFTVVAVVVLL
jgi:hypothetical protein